MAKDGAAEGRAPPMRDMLHLAVVKKHPHFLCGDTESKEVETAGPSRWDLIPSQASSSTETKPPLNYCKNVIEKIPLYSLLLPRI